MGWGGEEGYVCVYVCVCVCEKEENNYINCSRAKVEGKRNGKEDIRKNFISFFLLKRCLSFLYLSYICVYIYISSILPLLRSLSLSSLFYRMQIPLAN